MKDFTTFVLTTLRRAGWAPLSVFIIHVIASEGFNAYDRYPSLDIPMHFIGGVVICYFFYTAMQAPHAEKFLGSHTRFSLFVLLSALTASATVLWEFAEWIADHYFSKHAQGSVTDTMGDMLMGLLGSLCVSLPACLKKKP